MIRAAVLFSAALALPLQAEGLPVFDESLGFEIVGAVLDDGLLVNNNGTGFFCDVDDGMASSHLVLENCTPIIGPKAAAAFRGDDGPADIPDASGMTDVEFVAGLEVLPTAAFIPAIVTSLYTMGCVIDMDGGERIFLVELTHQIADQTGYTGPIDDWVVEAVEDLTEDAADMLVDQGRLVLDYDTKIATLTECL